jgi:hypothetical protein
VRVADGMIVGFGGVIAGSEDLVAGSGGGAKSGTQPAINTTQRHAANSDRTMASSAFSHLNGAASFLLIPARPGWQMLFYHAHLRQRNAAMPDPDRS